MPGMTGIELAIHFRKTQPECKVLLFSGQASTADLLERRARKAMTSICSPNLSTQPTFWQDWPVKRLGRTFVRAQETLFEGVKAQSDYAGQPFFHPTLPIAMFTPLAGRDSFEEQGHKLKGCERTFDAFTNLPWPASSSARPCMKSITASRLSPI